MLLSHLFVLLASLLALSGLEKLLLELFLNVFTQLIAQAALYHFCSIFHVNASMADADCRASATHGGVTVEIST